MSNWSGLQRGLNGLTPAEWQELLTRMRSIDEYIRTQRDLAKIQGGLKNANLNADMLDGYHAATSGNSRVVATDSAGNIFVSTDTAGLFMRVVNSWSNDQNNANAQFDVTAMPSEFAWAGSPFVTPNTISFGNSCLTCQWSSEGQRSFLYKTANVGTVARLVRVALRTNTAGAFIGHRIDDGTDNNYYEYVLRYDGSGVWSIRNRKRAGGGSVTDTSIMTINLPMWVALIVAASQGTRWSNWSMYGELSINAPYSGIHQSGMLSGATWTPTRQGIIYNWIVGWESGVVDAYW